MKPKEAWEMVFKLMEGLQKYHHTYLPANFKNKSGIKAKTDNDNTDLLNSHFYSLFDSEEQVNPSVLEKKAKHDIKNKLLKKSCASSLQNASKATSKN